MTGPQLEDSELGGLLEDLTNGSNIHPGIHLIAAGIRTIAEDQTLDRKATQLLLAELAGASDALDVIGLVGHLVARLADADTNAALRALPLDQQKEARLQGWLTCHNLSDPDHRDTTARACAALDSRKDSRP